MIPLTWGSKVWWSNPSADSFVIVNNKIPQSRLRGVLDRYFGSIHTGLFRGLVVYEVKTLFDARCKTCVCRLLVGRHGDRRGQGDRGGGGEGRRGRGPEGWPLRLHLLDEHLGRRDPLLPLLLEEPGDEIDELRRGPDLLELLGLEDAEDLLEERLLGGLAEEGHDAGHEVVDRDPERVEGAPDVEVGEPACLLRAQVLHGPHRGPGPGVLLHAGPEHA